MPLRRRRRRRVVRRTARRSRRRRRRRRRSRILVGGAVLLGVGGAAYGAVKLSKKDADKIEEYTGASVEELDEDELLTAMQDLGIQSDELDENDKAIITRESSNSQTTPVGPPESEPSYLDELDRLAALRDQGVISDDEFAAKKNQLLGP